MKLKLRIFALMAMLLCFAFQANAQVTTEADLRTAIAAGGEVTLGADIEVTAQVVVPEGVIATLDLNGYAITSVYQTGSDSKHIYPFNNYGNFTIKDSKGNGSITGRGIYVQAGSKLTVDGGSIYGIDSNGGSALFQYGGDIVINGAHIEQKATGTTNFAVNAAGGTVEVKGGWVGGNHGAIAAYNDAVVTIYDGKFVCTGTAGMTDNVLYTSGNGSITINGGTFIGDSDSASGGCCIYDANGKTTVNNGTFKGTSGGDVWGTTGTTINGGTFENLTETAHVAVGATITNGGKTYTKTENGLEEVTIVEVANFETLKAAVEAGKKVKLTADITVDESITVNDGTELDLNEKTLYINVENSFYNNVTIKNGNIVLGKDDVHVCDGYFEVNAGKTLVLDGVNMSSSAEGIKGYAVFHLKIGANLDLLNSTLNIADNEYAAGYIVYAGEATATVDVVKTTITGSKVNGIVHATTLIDESIVTLTNVIEHGINRSGVTIDDSNVAISGGTGRGITAQHGDLVITGNSTVEISDMGEATIELRNDKNLSIEETATVTLDVAVNNTSGGTISGDVVLPVYVAQIGDVKYTDLREAMVAATASDIVIMLDNVDLAGTEWEPVAFKGTFDGKDKVIKNLTINKPDVANTGFITSLNGTFKNVTFTNPTVTGGENTAVVAGRAGGSAALAENITINGTIKVETTHTGYARAAAIVGGWGYGNYKNITVDGGDKAASYIKHSGGGDGRYVAGIVGHADDVQSYENCTVKNITISGGWLCGAIAGPGPADGLATGCVVENVDMGADYSGGMFGWYFGSGTIEDATIKNVTFIDGSTCNGAIGGYSNNTNANVSNVIIENVKNNDGAPLLNHVAKVGEVYYSDLQEAIKAAAPAGTVELLADVVVDEWVMFSETLSISNGDIITTQINGLTINGNGKTVTVKDVESAGNGGRLFYDATNLNINNLTFNFVDNAANLGGIGLTAGTIENVTFNGGGYAIFPGTGEVTIEGCTFKTNATSIYYEDARDNLVVTGNTFENPDNVNVILLRGNTTFTDNTVISGRTVNVVSGSPVVTGNDFNDVRFKVYNVASATIEENTINNLAFNDESVVNSTFENNILSEAAQAVFDAANFPVPVAKVGDVEYTSLQAALNAAAAGTGNVTVTILKDVDLTGVTWDPVTVSGPGYPVVTVEGNYMTITGLTDMLFAGTWAGKSGLIIKNLTIANSAIVNDKEDSEGTVGVGAFIGYPQASATITLEKCHLKNSSVEGGHWTGGLIGMAGGYNGTDGPVFMNLTIKGCSVTGSTITGKGSAGGVIGHGSCAAWTNVVIEGTTVSGNTITSTGSSTNKAGAVMGTIGAAGQATTVNGVTNTGGASVSATVADNTVTSNGTEITTIYGRQGTETGMLYVAGGSYDNYPIEQGVSYAAPIEGYVIAENADGTYSLDEKVELPEVVITDIKGSLTESDPDLTFALNFSIKDLENLDEEYINKVMEQYGSWYTDYVLTISGLTDENVTFNSDGSGDGYLAGQYDAWSENWVSVPFEDVTLANGESIYIMEYAAKLMGQSGLRFTLAEIVSIVQNFDCGVYFSPEFLTANPGLEVDLHLKVFTEDAEGNKVNDINVATNEFDIADYVAIVHADGKQTTYCTTLAAAVAAAEADETITLIADVELTETLTIPADKTVALDLNGKTISQTKEQTAGYQMILNDGNLTIDDSSESKAGKISYTDSGNGGEYISDVIYNRSVLVINGGTIENLSSATVASNGYPHAVDTYSGIRDTYVEINGGTIYCAEYSAIRMFCVSATNKADLVINDGTIKGAIDMQNGTKVAALGTLTINDGTFEITKNANNIRFANWNGGATEYGVSAEIKGGSFNGGITTTYVPAAANWNKGIISGGTYAQDMTEYCADGYVCEANADGTYGIVNDPGYVAKWTFDDSNSEDYTNNTVLTVGTLTFKRTFIAGIWNPLYLPFDIELTDELLDKFEFYEYNQMLSTDTDGDRVPDDFAMELFVFQGGTLEANYPYFVRPKNAEACTMEVVMNNAYLYAADENSFETASMKNIFTLSGTHKSMTADELAGKFVMSTEGKWQPAGSNMKSHRLYLSITDRNGNSIASKAIRMVVRGEDGFEGTTGVDIVETDNAADGTIYDLSGRPVVEPVKGGMYIINGKKVVY